jgi:endonuclease YncB( thermonuclease family)
MPRRFRRLPGALTVLACVAGLALATAPSWRRPGDSQSDLGVSALGGSQVALVAGPCQIIRVVDGDTVLVAQHGQQFRVRLLGVVSADNPQAATTLRDLTRHAAASIELDRRRAAADGAWLAYLYSDSRLVNAAVVRAGWARYEPNPGDSSSHVRLLKEAEQTARRERLGIWGR